MHASELDDVEAAQRGRQLEETRERWPPILDVVEATAWWSRFDKYQSSLPVEALSGRVEPYRAPPKVGRNEPCPCGSGKKYKKCCGA
jgi:preprotein translocase subunit SecA